MTATVLVRYDEMCRAIDAAYEVDELKDIRDKAALLTQAARVAHNVEAERRACEIRLRAERKAGKLSAALETTQGRRTSVGGQQKSKAEQLRHAGISPQQRHDWEKLAAVPADKFEAALADQTRIPTTNGINRANAAPKVTPVSAEALWLWGRLKDFDRDGLLARTPADVMTTMTSQMLDDVHTLAPRVAAWLKQIGATR
jgi:hypothetical protein